MSTVSSTRPPTLGQASSEPLGEAVHEVQAVDLPSWEPSIVVDLEQLPAAPAPQQALSEEELALLDEELALEEQAEAARRAAASPGVPAPAVLRRTSVGEMPRVDLIPSVTMPAEEMTAHPSPDAVPGAKTPPPGTPLPVLLLVDQAHAAPPEEQPELARRINRLLDQMVLEGGSRHVADWFHHLIESGRLEGLADAAGHSCHETAIKGLLAMGFPYALEVRPEDLQRIQPPKERPTWKEYLDPLGMGVALLPMLDQWAHPLLKSPFPFPTVYTLEIGFSLLSLAAVL
ncbi:MAG TPA: hypothetical protein VF815_47035, partial [Myxococcaceae bacterium]